MPPPGPPPAARPPLRAFLGPPTLGGWLTILNCLGWAALQLTGRAFESHDPPAVVLGVLIVGFLAISLPLATWAWLPGLDWSPSLGDMVVMSVLAGLNAVLWGYGLAWFLRWTRPRSAVHAPHRDRPPPP